MTDDSIPHKWRIGKQAFIFLMTGLALLPFLTGGLLFLTWNVWNEYTLTKQQIHTLHIENMTLRTELERLQTFKQLLEDDQPNTTPAETTPQQREKQSTTKNTTQTPQSPSVTQHTPKAAITSPKDTIIKKQLIDLGIVRVADVNTRLNTEGQLEIHFDLYKAATEKTSSPLSGTIEISLIDRNGTETKLKHDDSTFRILRLKKVESLSTLPKNVRVDGSKVMVNIFVDTKLVFRTLVPLVS